jgi:hypothetical protein
MMEEKHTNIHIGNWFQKLHKEAHPTLRHALHTGQFFSYFYYRVKLYLLSNGLDTLLHMLEIWILFQLIEKEIFASFLTLRILLTIGLSGWWGSLERARLEVRSHFPKNTPRVSKILTQSLQQATMYIIASGALFYGFLIFSKGVASLNTIEFIIYNAMFFTYSLQVLYQAYHACIYAIRRVYKPISVIFGQIIFFNILLIIAHIHGHPLLLYATFFTISLLHVFIGLFYTHKAYKSAHIPIRTTLKKDKKVGLTTFSPSIILKNYSYFISGVFTHFPYIIIFLIIKLKAPMLHKIPLDQKYIFGLVYAFITGWSYLMYFDAAKLHIEKFYAQYRTLLHPLILWSLLFTCFLSLGGCILSSLFLNIPFSLPSIFLFYFLSSLFSLCLFLLFAANRTAILSGTVLIATSISSIFYIFFAQTIFTCLLLFIFIGMVLGAIFLYTIQKPMLPGSFLALWRWKTKVFSFQKAIHVILWVSPTLPLDELYTTENRLRDFAEELRGYITQLKPRVFIISYETEHSMKDIKTFWTTQLTHELCKIKVTSNPGDITQSKSFHRWVRYSKKVS